MAKVAGSGGGTYEKGDTYKGTGAPPGNAADWNVVVNKAGVFVGYVFVGDGKGNAPKYLSQSSSSTGGSSGGGGGGGGSANAGLSAYTQAYRLMFDDAGVKPPSDLLQKADAGNWSIAYFKMMVRLQDKAYFKSAEAKKNLSELRSYWNAVLPGVKLNRQFARDYLRHGWTATQLQNQISKLPAFQKQYPFWKAFTRAQRQQGAAKAVNPLQYKAYAAGFTDVWKQSGGVAPQGYERLFFKSGLSDQEFAENYSMLAQGNAAAKWDVGGLTEQQRRSELFNGKGASQVRGLLQIALNKQQQYMRAPGSGFRVAEDDGLVTMRGI
ncbi:MAG: hypothetical protein PHU54_06180 [Candidatus Omnitrophica bacterium]|nr:hypothetical protein [Candidatus Omnitrophota bacterium]